VSGNGNTRFDLRPLVYQRKMKPVKKDIVIRTQH